MKPTLPKATPPRQYAENPPHPVDLHVGARLRLRRRLAKISQRHLAESLGVTFQQVQKYETGANRVSASKLHDIAKMLGAPVAWFFEGYEDASAASDEMSPEALRLNQVQRFLGSIEGARLAVIYPTLGLGPQRQLLALAESLAAAPNAKTRKAGAV